MAGSEGSVVVDLADLFDQLNQNALSEFRADEVNDDILHERRLPGKQRVRCRPCPC